jgi:FixJ family two-component response regulator
LARVPLIAIVDDDDAVRIAAESLVRSLGHLVRSFASAEEFLESGIAGTAACLVTDVHMPGISGLDLQDLLIARGQEIPVIIITAYPEEAIQIRAQAAGAAAILTKPFDGQSLADSIMDALREEKGS